MLFHLCNRCVVWYIQYRSYPGRVLARISKMPVQNSNFKRNSRPDLAIYLLQILIPATFNILVCQKGQLTLPLCPRRWFVRKIFGYYTSKLKNHHRNLCLSKQEFFWKLPVQETVRSWLSPCTLVIILIFKFLFDVA